MTDKTITAEEPVSIRELDDLEWLAENGYEFLVTKYGFEYQGDVYESCSSLRRWVEGGEHLEAPPTEKASE